MTYRMAVLYYGDKWIEAFSRSARYGHEWSAAHDDFVFQVARALDDEQPHMVAETLIKKYAD